MTASLIQEKMVYRLPEDLGEGLEPSVSDVKLVSVSLLKKLLKVS